MSVDPPQPPAPDDDPGDEFTGVYPGPDGTRHGGESGADPMGATFRSQGMRWAWNAARRGGMDGITVKEYRERYDIHHGRASAHLSNLHEAGYLAKLKERRDKCGIYVLPSLVDDRPTVPHVRNAPKRVRETIVEVEVVREVRVEVPVEVVRVVEKEVPVEVVITKADVTKVVKQWQEDKIRGRVFGMDGLADGLLALIQSKMKGSTP